MAKPIEAAKPLAKREPVVIGTAIITVLSAVIIVLPDLGLNIPQGITKGLAAVIILAGGFGIRSKVRPA